MYHGPPAAGPCQCRYRLVVGRHQPNAYLVPVRGYQTDDIPFVEYPLYRDDADGQQARCRRSEQGLDSTRIEVKFPFGKALRVGYPPFDARGGFVARDKTGADNRFALGCAAQ